MRLHLRHVGSLSCFCADALRVLRGRCLGPCCRPGRASSSPPRSCAGPGSQPPRFFSSCCFAERSSHATVAVDQLVDLGLGLLLRRADHHEHVAAVLLGGRLHEAELGHVVGEALQQLHAHLGTGLLTSAEHDHDLDLVAALEEAGDVALLGGVVVLVDLRAELDLLDDRVDLVLPCLTGLLRGFVLVLAVVHELGDGRTRHRGDLDQVEIGLGRQPQRVLDAHDADLLPVGADQPHFGDANAVIDPRFSADGSSSESVSFPTEKAPAHAEALNIDRRRPNRHPDDDPAASAARVGGISTCNGQPELSDNSQEFTRTRAQS